MFQSTKRLALVLALTACSRGGVGTVTFGAAGPWSEAYGAANKRGIDLALEEINNSPEWAGKRRLNILFKDDSGSGVVASDIAQRFVADVRVVAVVGHVNSSAMVAAAHVYDRHLPAVATTATSPLLTGLSPWAFRVISSDSANGRTIARFANQLKYKRAVVLYENNAYGRGLAENFRRAFSGQVLSFDPIGEEAGTDASGLAFLGEARRQQLAAELIGGDGWQTLAASPAADGVVVGAPFSAQDKRPEVQAFVAAYRKKYDALPDGNAALAYDATRLLAAAVEKVGPDRERIRDYLADLAEPFKGVTGGIRFRPNGDPIGKNVIMTRIRHGQLQIEDGQ
jgi:branched-chain amino acid transport system substrate-binding protein